MAKRKAASKNLGRASEIAQARLDLGKRPASEPLHFGSKQIAKKRGGVRAGSD
jgi:hypothetical protein